MVPLKSFAKEKIEELYQLFAFPRSLILFLQTSLLEESQDFFFLYVQDKHLHLLQC